MFGCCSWGTMNLAWAVKYAVQAGWARFVLFPLIELGATESAINYRVLGIIIVLMTLVFIASRFMGDVSQVLRVAPGRNVLASGCGLVFGLMCCFISATKWPVNLVLCW